MFYIKNLANYFTYKINLTYKEEDLGEVIKERKEIEKEINKLRNLVKFLKSSKKTDFGEKIINSVIEELTSNPDYAFLLTYIHNDKVPASFAYKRNK